VSRRKILFSLGEKKSGARKMKRAKSIFLRVFALNDSDRRRGFNTDSAKRKSFFCGKKDFALPRLLFQNGGDLISSAQEGAGGMRGGNMDGIEKL